MKIWMALLVLYFGFLAAMGREQERGYHWFDPPKEIMVTAARRGFDGDKTQFLEIYRKAGDPCVEAVWRAAIVTPTLWAQGMGYERARKFQEFPSDAEIMGYVRKATFFITYGSSSYKDDIGVALRVNGQIRRAIKIREPSAADACHSADRDLRWMHSSMVDFDSGELLPESGKGELLIRMSLGREDQIEIDFGSLP